jgi:hypothetical protein
MERYADQGHSVRHRLPRLRACQARGRIGRRFFYFRFRGDCASLTIGSRRRREDGSYFKRDRTKALRTLRRWADDGDALGLERFMAQKYLRRDHSMDRHPSVPVRYAVIHDVTGEPCNGYLEPDEAAELFTRLMDSLERCAPRPPFRKYRAIVRGSHTVPSRYTQDTIRKPSQRSR